MNATEEKIINLMNKLEPLMNKTVFCDGKLYKFTHYSTIYIYAFEYEKDKENKLDDDIILYSIGNYIYFRHFLNKLSKIKIKLKISNFYEYKVLENTEDIETIYFKNNEVIENYYDSLFYNDEVLLNLKYALKKLIISLNAHFLKLSGEYYYKIRVEYLEKIYNYYDTEENIIIKLLLDELTTEYKTLTYDEYLKLNYYDEYLKLYNEYKAIINII